MSKFLRERINLNEVMESKRLSLTKFKSTSSETEENLYQSTKLQKSDIKRI